LNEDLVEAICFAHDLGHPPFGHAGEAELHRRMAPYGGFDHNTQSLRIVEWLEERYPGFRGLNLTWEVRDGMLKHPTHGGALTPDAQRLRPRGWPSLEGQVSDLADAIAYNAHDLDDGLRAGLLHWEDLRRDPFLAELIAAVERDHAGLPANVLRHQLVRHAIDTQVTDLITQTEANLRRLGVATLADVRAAAERVAVFSPAMAQRHTDLKRFLRRNLYDHPRVERMGQDAATVVGWLFAAFMRDAGRLPPPVQARLAEGADPAPRIICDYIAGMTDRFALHEFIALGGDLAALAPAWSPSYLALTGTANEC
jgi:dGTPase